MLQALSNIQKNSDESIQEYGGRVNQLLNKFTSQVMKNTALASKADHKIKSWGRVDGSVSVSVPPAMSGSGLKNKFWVDQLKRVAHMQKGDNYKSKRDLDKVQCFDCKEFEYYKRNCPNKQNKIIKDKEGGQCNYCYRNNQFIGVC